MESEEEKSDMYKGYVKIGVGPKLSVETYGYWHDIDVEIVVGEVKESGSRCGSRRLVRGVFVEVGEKGFGRDL